MSLRSRLHAGDPDAFRELFDEHVRTVYNVGFRLTGNWSVAEDIASLTFLEAWRLRERIDVDAEAGTLRPWLLGIATNVARNVRRAARRYEDAVLRLPPAEPVPDPADEVAHRIDDRDRVGRVLAALAKLSRADREVLVLCVWSGLDYGEAARALGIPIGTVRSRLSRARRKLEALLAAMDSAARDSAAKEPAPRSGQVLRDRPTAVRIATEEAR